MIVICGLLLWGGVTESPFQIEWFVYAQTAAYLFTLILSLIVVYSKAQFLKLKFDRNYFIAILKKSYPFALLSLLMAFYYRIDSVMLERMLPDGKEQAGIYAQSFRILDAVAMFAFLYAGLLLPMFSRMIKQKRSIRQLTLFSFLLLIVPVVGITFASYFYRGELIDLLYYHHVETSATIFGVLILCFLGIATSYIFGTLLTANGNLRILNFMAFGGVLINIILNLILIPGYKAFGSAIASLATQSFIALFQVMMAKKIFQFSIDLKRVVIFVLFIGGVLLFSMFSVELDFSWIYKFVAILVFTIIFAFLLRLIHLKVLVDLLKHGDEI